MESVSVCDACGEPPRKRKDGSIAPLKSCSRCKSVWYHDTACQRAHYPNHKGSCLASKKPLLDKSKDERPSAPEICKACQTSITKKERKGRCLVSSLTTTIKTGSPIVQHQTPYCVGGSRRWKPLVPPALSEEFRSTRCAYCFKIMPPEGLIHAICNSTAAPYELRFCSSACKANGTKEGFDIEMQAVEKICGSESSRGPPRIFTSAVLLFRLILQCYGTLEVTGDIHRKDLQSDLDQLQSQITGEIESEESFCHTQAVISTVYGMCCAMPGLMASICSMDNLSTLLSKIKINGFSICDGESVALGVGLYSSAVSSMNHSCKPNAIQTFMYGRSHEPPTLMVTACEDIFPGEEIHISYIDNTCPRQTRRARLQRDYGFWCTCTGCQDDRMERETIGLRCPKCPEEDGAEVSISIVNREREGFVCNGCGYSNFDEQWALLQHYEEKVQFSRSAPSLKQLVGVYQRICLDSSWYIIDANERLLQSLLDEIGGLDNQRGRNIAIQALDVVESMVQNQRQSHPTHTLKRHVWNFKRAKLMLFANPDPRQGMVELQRVSSALALFYPKDHELMIGLEESLFQASVNLQ